MKSSNNASNSSAANLEGVKIGHLNVQSLNPSLPKFPDIYNLFLNSNLDVIGVSETFLKPAVFDKAIEIPGFKVFRCDRMDRIGGGVLFYVSNKLDAKCIYSYSNSGNISSCYECLFLEIKLQSSVLLLGVAYVPPSSSPLALEETINSLSNKYENFVLVGDFNTNLLSLVGSSLIENLCIRNNINVKHNNTPTHYDVYHNSQSLIDFFLIDSIGKVNCSSQCSVSASISKHSFIFIDFGCSPIRYSSPTSYSYRNVNAIDVNALLDEACHIDLSPILRTSDVDLQLSLLNDAFNILLNKFAPIITKTRTRKQKFPFIKNPDLKASKVLRELAFSEYKRNPSSQNWSVYCRNRNKVTKLIRKLKIEHSSNLFSPSLPTKKIWSTLKSLGTTSTQEEISSSFDVNSVNNYFVQNCSPSLLRSDTTLPEHSNSFSFRSIDSNELWIAMCSVKSNAVGFDGTPIAFIRMLFPAFNQFFLFFVNSIFTTSKFPAPWKKAIVLPIPKKPNPSSTDDLRPISILPAFSKVVEFLIKSQIENNISLDSLIFKYQSGFRRSHNTTTAILEFTETIREELDSNKLFFSVSLDFQKAFDVVSHSILLSKIKSSFLFSTSACNLLHSYLSDRSQCVKIGSELSDFKMVSSGVPQGSLLGPLLFSFFINDIPLCLKSCSARLFADDFMISKSCIFDDLDTTITNINDDLARISNWANLNNININPSKTKAICFTSKKLSMRKDLLKINDTNIEFVNKLKFLGFFLDKALTWSDHINATISKVNFSLKRLYNLHTFLPPHVKKQIAHALLISVLSYGIEVISGTYQYNLNSLKLCINNIARYIFSVSRRAHISNFVSSFLGCSFENFIKIRCLLSMFKIIYHRQPLYLYEKVRSTRSLRNSYLIPPCHRHTIMQNSFFVRVTKYWNSLPDPDNKLFQCSPLTFKKRLFEIFNSI